MSVGVGTHVPSVVGLGKTHPSDGMACSFVSIWSSPEMLGFVFIREGRRHLLMRSEGATAPSSCLTPKPEPWLGVFLQRPHKRDESLSLFKRKSGQRDFWAEGLWLHVHPREETLEETEDNLALSLGAL